MLPANTDVYPVGKNFPTSNGVAHENSVFYSAYHLYVELLPFHTVNQVLVVRI